VRPHEWSAYQLPPLAGFVLVVSSAWVPPAPAFCAPLQAVVHPVTLSPAPTSKPATLSPATNFFKSFFSMPCPSLHVDFDWFSSRNEGRPNRKISPHFSQPMPYF
jgi:hypothetical protein